MPTPDEWRNLLLKRLDERKGRITRYIDYNEGRHDSRYITQEFREAFGRLFSGYAENFCPLISEAVNERLGVNGFRLGKDLKADEDANRIWQDNGLDAEAQLCHVEALVKSESAVIVSPFRSEWPKPDAPLITVEDPLQVIVALDPSDRRKRTAALKSWVDDEGFLNATLYLPNFVFKWRSKQKRSEFELKDTAQYLKVQWERRQGEVDEEWPLRNPLQLVPVVPFVNRPSLNRRGRSEIEEVMPIQDAVNQAVRNMLLIAETAGFPQRYGINILPEVDTVEPHGAHRGSRDRRRGRAGTGARATGRRCTAARRAADPVRPVPQCRPRSAGQDGRAAHPAHRHHHPHPSSLPLRVIGHLPIRRVAESHRNRAGSKGQGEAAPLRGLVGRGHAPGLHRPRGCERQGHRL